MAFVTRGHLITFAAAVVDNVANLFVRKENGKGLSSNDYTAEDREKLRGLPDSYLAAGSQTEESAEDGGVNVYTFERSDGTASDFTVRNGSRGSKGEKGDAGPAGVKGEKGDSGQDGVSVVSVEQTAASDADGGINIFTVTLSNGETSEFRFKNGSRGSAGAPGPKGDTGLQGIQGPKGDTGATGPAGSAGAAGTAAGFGSITASVDANVGTPSVSVESSGPNTAKVLKFIFRNLKGAAGAQGPKGDTGATGPQGAKGDKGDTGARGPTGAQGPQGIQGPKGDTGAAGAKGAAGTRGSMIYWGTGIIGTNTTATVFSGSGVSSALVNDFYLNTNNWNVYQCTTAGAASAAKWVYKGNIRGATGATGATGAAGKNATTTAVATASANGLMGKEMVTKLDSAAQGKGITFSVVNGILTVTY